MRSKRQQTNTNRKQVKPMVDFWRMKPKVITKAPIQIKKPLISSSKKLISSTVKIKPKFSTQITKKIIPSPYKRTIKERSLIKAKPWEDRDGDGVPNWIDCKPFNKLKQGRKEWSHEPPITRKRIRKAIQFNIGKDPIKQIERAGYSLTNPDMTENILYTKKIKNKIKHIEMDPHSFDIISKWETDYSDENKNMVPDKYEEDEDPRWDPSTKYAYGGNKRYIIDSWDGIERDEYKEQEERDKNEGIFETSPEEKDFYKDHDMTSGSISDSIDYLREEKDNYYKSKRRKK